MSADKTVLKISTEEREDFDRAFILRSTGPGLWQAYNRTTNDTASPIYNDREAACYYVIREMRQEAEDAIVEMLGGTDEYICR